MTTVNKFNKTIHKKDICVRLIICRRTHKKNNIFFIMLEERDINLNFVDNDVFANEMKNLPKRADRRHYECERKVIIKKVLVLTETVVSFGCLKL